MPQTEAQRRAKAKYNAKSYDRLEVKVLKGNKDIILHVNKKYNCFLYFYSIFLFFDVACEYISYSLFYKLPD